MGMQFNLSSCKVSFSIAAAPILLSLLATGCSNNTVVPANSDSYGQMAMIPLSNPIPIKSLEVYDQKSGKRISSDILSMKSSDIRKRLTTYEAITTIQKRDVSGGLTYLGSGAKVGKGSYVITFDYVNSSTQEVVFDEAKRRVALGKIGVGVRITAEITTKTNDINISGLIPLGVAYQSNNISGGIYFKAFGLNNDKVPSLIPVDMQELNAAGLQKAFEAAATVRVLMSLDETSLEPYLIGVTGVGVSDAREALDAAKKKVGG